MKLPPKPKKPQLESDIQRDVRCMVTDEFADVWLARNNSGALPDETGRLVYYGLGEGSADLVGGIKVFAWIQPPDFTPRSILRSLAIEMKRPGKKATQAQKDWHAFFRSMGGVSLLECTSVDEAREFLRKVRAWEM